MVATGLQLLWMLLLVAIATGKVFSRAGTTRRRLERISFLLVCHIINLIYAHAHSAAPSTTQQITNVNVVTSI